MLTSASVCPQEHHTHREPHRGAVGVRRGVAQLPSRVPVGLQGGRAGQLPVKLQHGVHRRVRPARSGVQPEDCQRQSGGEAVTEDGRRHQTAPPPAPQSPPRGGWRLGMGRRGHGRRRQAGRASHRLTAMTVAADFRSARPILNSIF